MTETTSLPELVAVPVRTAAGLHHVTGQTIDEAGLLAIHPELTEYGFSGRWQITHVMTGEHFSIPSDGMSSVWSDRLALTAQPFGGGR